MKKGVKMTLIILGAVILLFLLVIPSAFASDKITVTVDGEEIYFIPNPALGLWINREKF